MGIVPNKEVIAKGNNSSIEEDAYPVPNANKVTKKPIKTDGTIAIPPQIKIQIFNNFHFKKAKIVLKNSSGFSI